MHHPIVKISFSEKIIIAFDLQKRMYSITITNPLVLLTRLYEDSCVQDVFNIIITDTTALACIGADSV